MVLLAHHFSPLPDCAPAPGAPGASATDAPERVQLLPPGRFWGRDGRGPYYVADAAALIAASLTGPPIVIDVGHATDRGIAEAPAYGRVAALEMEESGLWGRVDWTPRGRRALMDRDYFGISPVFYHEADGSITQILRASLTNIPNLPLKTLNHQGAGMALMDDLKSAPGLAPGAPEGEISAAAAKAEIEALKAELVSLKAERAAEQAHRAVERAVQSRKAAPAERDPLLAYYSAVGAEKFAAAMAARPEVFPGHPGHPGQPGQSPGSESPEALGYRAAHYRAAQAVKGISLTATDAVLHCQKNPEAGR